MTQTIDSTFVPVLQQFIPSELEVPLTANTNVETGPVNAALLANLEKKGDSPFLPSDASLQPQQPNAPPEKPTFPPLELVTKPNLTTKELAYYSNMAEQTWRVKACYENFPDGLRPLRVCGKLAWPTASVKKLLGVK